MNQFLHYVAAITFFCMSVKYTQVATTINGHRDKQSSNLSCLSGVNNKIAQTKCQNIFKQCLS